LATLDFGNFGFWWFWILAILNFGNFSISWVLAILDFGSFWFWRSWVLKISYFGVSILAILYFGDFWFGFLDFSLFWFLASWLWLSNFPIPAFAYFAFQSSKILIFASLIFLSLWAFKLISVRINYFRSNLNYFWSNPNYCRSSITRAHPLVTLPTTTAPTGARAVKVKGQESFAPHMLGEDLGWVDVAAGLFVLCGRSEALAARSGVIAVPVLALSAILGFAKRYFEFCEKEKGCWVLVKMILRSAERDVEFCEKGCWVLRKGTLSFAKRDAKFCEKRFWVFRMGVLGFGQSDFGFLRKRMLGFAKSRKMILSFAKRNVEQKREKEKREESGRWWWWRLIELWLIFVDFFGLGFSELGILFWF
jgi:hypothetical protein